MIDFNGSRHILTQDFLFTPTPAARLRARRSAIDLSPLSPGHNVGLDEPTNDLDAETLELFEELLHDYEGTVLLVSHDRAFLNNVVTSTLVLRKGCGSMSGL